MSAKYRALISKFIDHRISAQEFQTTFLKLFKNEKAHGLSAEFDILDGLFADADDYVADAELREKARELYDGKLFRTLDDAELRVRAREAYRKLYEG
jgi:hypothetical protein